MKSIFSVAFLFLALLYPTVCDADNYPKNFDIDIQHYQFKLWLSDQHDSIRVDALIVVLLKKAGIQQVRLDLTHTAPELNGKGMTVTHVTANGQTLSFSHRGGELFVSIPASEAGQIISIAIQYKGIPDAGLAIKQNRYNDRSFFSDNWPNLGHHWLPLIDHPYDKATCEFIVIAPSHYKVVSNGLLQEESMLLDGNKLTHWKQSVPIASWLFVLGVADFAVQYVDSFEGKSIETWVYRQDREAGFHDFQIPTQHALSFFSDYVGPFAYEKLANIQSNNSTGGMEAASAIMYSEKSVSGKRENRWQEVIVHEVAHQWFGDAVTETDWDDVWLSEGFATYFTLLYKEHRAGRDEFVRGLKASREQIIQYMTKNQDAPIVHQQLSDMSKVTSALTYQKGAWVLHMLRNLVGDIAFKRGIRSYYQKYFNGNATTSDFRKEMEIASGQNLQNFFAQWLYQPGMPHINGKWSWDSKKRELRVTLAQTQTQAFSFNLEIGVATSGSDSIDIKNVNVTSSQSTFTIPVATKPLSITLDPRTTLLCVFELSQQ